MLVLQQISFVKYEQDECSVYCSAIKYMLMCMHVYNCSAPTQKAACMYQQVFNHSYAATKIKYWQRTIDFFSVEVVDNSTVDDIFLAFKPVFYFVYTTKLLC